jgi:sugar-specific transcriptional regulator TrmB
MDIETALEGIGLAQNEIKVYVALSRIGESTANKVAEASSLHRTNVYDTLERLSQKGLVSHIFKQGTKYFRTTNPEQLILMLEEKKKQVESILPQLKVQEKLTGQENYAEVVEGLKGFCNILENFLNYNDDILVYGIPKEAPEHMKYFISGFHTRRLAKNIVMKHIYNFNAQERIQFLNKMPNTEARFLSEEFDSRVNTLVCGEEVVFTLWSEKIWSIRVKNKEIADSYKKYFVVLWEKAKVN